MWLLTLPFEFGEISLNHLSMPMKISSPLAWYAPATSLLLMAAFLGFCAPLIAADDLNALYQNGRAAFHQGDYATAQALLSRVAAANPTHTDTQNMLRYIKTHAKPGVSNLRHEYEAVIIPKVDLRDVTLAEAVEGLGGLAKNASGGKVGLNVILKGTNLRTRKVNLSLTQVPLSQLLEYIAQLTESKLSYEKHAVVFSEHGRGATPPPK